MEDKKMNVLFLIGSLAVGGKERLLLDVFDRREDLPFDAWCVCRKGPGDFSKGIITIPSKQIFRFLCRLRKEVISRKTQVIHAQSAFDALLAVLATIGLKTKVVQTFHSYEFSTKTLSRILEKLSFALCAKSVFVSGQQMKHFADVHNLSQQQQTKQVLIYNGVNFDRFPFSEHEPGERLQMAMVGNFVPEKDQLFVCEFLKRLNEKYPNFYFYFVGERKEQYPACHRQCIDYCEANNLNDNVRFLGRRDDVPELLSKMDAFVYCSRSETFGLAVVEAVSMGLPSFVNDLPVFREVFQEGRLATLFRTGDMDQLCNTFDDFLAHREAYRQQAAANAKLVRDTYSITTYISNLDSLYSQLIIKYNE